MLTKKEQSEPSAPPPAASFPTPVQLLTTFATISACSFGGVLAWARRIIVQERGWLSPEEFNEQFALCQVLPGGNILNFAVMYGCRCAGVIGSLAAVLGLIGPPVALMIVAGTLYRRYGDLPALHGVFASLAAAAAGLLIATALQMVAATVKNRLRPLHVVALLTFLAVGVLRWPLLWVMAVIAPVGIALAWWERR
jgi:chromate transporter